MGDARHREKLRIYRESLNLKMQGMIIEHTATHLGKKSCYIYKNIHNRRIGAYLNGKQKTALKYVSKTPVWNIQVRPLLWWRRWTWFTFPIDTKHLSTLNVANLYKRWLVELCFKWLKQHLKIKIFQGTAENAVRIQISVTIITYCLVAIIQYDM